MTETAKKILVIKLGALGDIILALEVFHAIRAHHPHAHLTLLTRPAYAALGRRMPWFQQVLTDTEPRWWQVRRLLELRRQCLAANFYRVYDLQCNDRTGFYFRLLWPSAPEWSGAVPGCSHPRPCLRERRLPATERLLEQVAKAGVKPAGRPDLNWLLEPLDGLPVPERFILLVPGCSAHRPGKRWPAARYAELSRRFRQHGIATVVVGTAADREAVESLVAQAPEAVNLAGRTSIGQLAALALRAMVVVGNDTGPVHIMATAGAPTLVVMSQESDPVLMLPRGPALAFVQVPDLRELSVDRVCQALEESLPVRLPRLYPG